MRKFKTSPCFVNLMDLRKFVFVLLKYDKKRHGLSHMLGKHLKFSFCGRNRSETCQYIEVVTPEAYFSV